MLLNVFGHWINPDNITHIRIGVDRSSAINFSHPENYIVIGKGAEEVAEEINRQLEK